jgi:hypothetical protein
VSAGLRRTPETVLPHEPRPPRLIPIDCPRPFPTDCPRPLPIDRFSRPSKPSTVRHRHRPTVEGVSRPYWTDPGLSSDKHSGEHRVSRSHMDCECSPVPQNNLHHSQVRRLSSPAPSSRRVSAGVPADVPVVPRRSQTYGGRETASFKTLSPSTLPYRHSSTDTINRFPIPSSSYLDVHRCMTDVYDRGTYCNNLTATYVQVSIEYQDSILTRRTHF